MRVGLTPTPCEPQARAGQERRGDDERRGRGEVAGHVEPERLEPLGRPDLDPARLALRRARPPRGASARCGRGSATGSTTVGRPVRRRKPGEQDARLHLRARDRQLVPDRAQRRAVDRRAAARPSVGLDAGAHLASAASAIRSIGRERSDSSPTSSNRRPSLAGEDARRAAGRACPALPQSIGPAGACRPRSPTPRDADDVVALLVDLDAERPHGGDRRLGVAGAAEAARSRTRPRRPRRRAPRGARSTCRPGTATPPWTDDAGSILTLRAPGETDDAVALRLEQRRGARRLAPRRRRASSARRRARARSAAARSPRC